MNAKMTQFMYDLNLLLDKRYDIVMNDNADKWYGARIVIHADFNYKNGCRISKEFEELIEKNGFRCDVIERCTIGLWRK